MRCISEQCEEKPWMWQKLSILISLCLICLLRSLLLICNYRHKISHCAIQITKSSFTNATTAWFLFNLPPAFENFSCLIFEFSEFADAVNNYVYTWKLENSAQENECLVTSFAMTAWWHELFLALLSNCASLLWVLLLLLTLLLVKCRSPM